MHMQPPRLLEATPCVGGMRGSLGLQVGARRRGGTVRFSWGDRPLSRHLRAWMMKWDTAERCETVRMKRHSWGYVSWSSTPAQAQHEQPATSGLAHPDPAAASRAASQTCRATGRCQLQQRAASCTWVADKQGRTQAALDGDRNGHSGLHGRAALRHELWTQHERRAEAAGAGDPVAGATAVQVDLIVPAHTRSAG